METAISVVVCTAFALCMGYMLFVILKSRIGPLVKVPALVVRRRVGTVSTRSGVYYEFYLSFETQDGYQTEYEVPEELFLEVNVGDTGVLTHRSEVFKGFTVTAR